MRRFCFCYSKKNQNRFPPLAAFSRSFCSDFLLLSSIFSRACEDVLGLLLSLSSRKSALISLVAKLYNRKCLNRLLGLDECNKLTVLIG